MLAAKHFVVYCIFFFSFQQVLIAQKPRLQLPAGQIASLTGAYCSNDGSLFATIGFKDRNLFIWDVKTGKLLTIIEDRFSSLGQNFATFSSDGSILCLISNDPEQSGGSVWDLKNSKLLLDLYRAAVSRNVILNNVAMPKEGEENEYAYSSPKIAAFTGENGLLAILYDSIIKVFDLRSKQIAAIIKSPVHNFTSIQFSPDAALLSCSSEKEAIAWNTADFKEAFRFNKGEKIFFTKSRSQMIVAGNSVIEIYSPGNSKIERTVDFPSARSLSFSNDDKEFIAVTDGLASLFNVKTGSVLHKWTGVSDAWFHPGVKSIITTKGRSYSKNQWVYNDNRADRQGDTVATEIETWDGVTFQKLRNWKQQAGDFVFICGSGDKIFGTDGNGILSKSITTGVVIQHWSLRGKIPVYATTISPGSKRIITNSAYINTWDSHTGKMLGSVSAGQADPQASEEETRIVFSPDGSFFSAVSEGIWQLIGNEGQLLAQSKKKYSGMAAAAFSNKADKVVFIYPGQAELYELSSRSVKKYAWGSSLPDAAIFSPGDSLIVVSYNEKNITEMRSLQGFRIIKTVKGVIKDGQGIFNYTGKKMITFSSGMDSSYIWNLLNGRLLQRVSGLASFSPVEDKVVTDLGIITGLAQKDAPVSLEGGATEYYKNGNSLNKNVYAHFTPDGQKVIEYGESYGSSLGYFRSVSAWDAKSGKLLNPPPADGWTGDAISRSGKKIFNFNVYGDTTGRIMSIIDLDKNDTINLPRSPEESALWFASFSPDDEYLLMATGLSVKKWETATGKLLFTFFPVDTSDYMVMIPGGYYYCSPDAAKALHYVNGLQVIGFDQLDTRYNRPDKVLSHINSQDTALINAYRKAWVKRITRLGMDTSFFRNDFNVPVADILNRQYTGDVVQQESLHLQITASDSTYPIDRFNIWVNEVPLYGMRGLPVNKKSRFDTTISISLSYGDNRIETSVTNVNGAESYRSPLIIKYIPQVKPDPKVYFIGIGINNFSDTSYNLRWCVKDIKELVKALQAKYKSQLIILDTLFNEKVNRAGVQALKEKLYAAGVNDKVILSYSGHGLYSKDRDYYLSSYNMDFKKPEGDGIPYEEIENLLDSIKPRMKMLLLDACNSGETDKEELQLQGNTAPGQNNNNADPAGSIEGGSVNSLSGAAGQNSFELMQSLFANVGKATGAVIIAASGGKQSALEQNILGHGVFTYSVIEAMNKFSTIKISGLKKYIGNRVLELTKGRQKPTTRNELIAADWNVW